jgi:hypothetical protein
MDLAIWSPAFVRAAGSIWPAEGCRGRDAVATERNERI